MPSAGTAGSTAAVLAGFLSYSPTQNRRNPVTGWVGGLVGVSVKGPSGAKGVGSAGNRLHHDGKTKLKGREAQCFYNAFNYAVEQILGEILRRNGGILSLLAPAHTDTENIDKFKQNCGREHDLPFLALLYYPR